MVHAQPHEAPHEMARDQLESFMEERRRLFWLIVLNIRPFAMTCTTYLEYMLYPPGTEANDSFELLEVPWQNMLFMVAGMPIRDMVQVRAIVEECGLRIADGVPMAITSVRGQLTKVFFPMNTRRCFTLENKRETSPTTFSVAQVGRIHEAEKRLCSKIHDGWRPTKEALGQRVAAIVRNVRDGRPIV